jgi:hypothetical protein
MLDACVHDSSTRRSCGLTSTATVNAIHNDPRKVKLHR